MSKHTQGRLKMRQGFDDETKELYAPDPAIKKPFEPRALATVEADDAEGRANARRLVACWNACINIRTEALADEAPQPEADALDEGRSDAEIVAQTEALARYLLSWRWGQEPENPDTQMRNSENPRAQKSWQAACEIQNLVTATDAENAAAEIDAAKENK